MNTPIQPSAPVLGQFSTHDENVHFPWSSMSPAVRHAQSSLPGGSNYVIVESTRIHISDPKLHDLATRLAVGFAAAANLNKTPEVLMEGVVSPGDVLLRLEVPNLSDVEIPPAGVGEAYRIDIDSNFRAIFIIAATNVAMARALTTLHKAVQVSATLAPGVVIDSPAYAERSVMMDVGRKYYSPVWMKNLLREMAWNQLNTLHLHLTDNEGVRVIFPSFPDTASPDAWSAAELKDILDTAASYYIEVIPEIETPGHMDWMLRNRPEFHLRLSNSTIVSKALDFSIPAARDFLKTIIRETLDMFPHSRHFHLGADEYFLHPIDLKNTPQLAQYAREESGKPGADSEDAVRYFVNDLATLVQEKRKIARVWNDGAVRRNPAIALDKETEIECWSIWGTKRGEMNVQELVDNRYRVKNAHGDYYFIIRANWDNLNHPKHSPHGLYDDWRANRFMDKAGESLTVIAPESQCMVGAGIQVWADEPAFWRPEEVWRQLIQWILPLGQRTWDSPHAAPTYAKLSDIAR